MIALSRSNLIAWWKPDNTGTVWVIPDKFNKNPLVTVQTVAAPTCTEIDGRLAISYAGGQMLSAKHVENFNAIPFTVEGWIYCTNAASVFVVIRKNPFSSWTLYNNGSNGLRLRLHLNGSITDFATAYNLTENVWTHIGFDYSGEDANLFVNGEPEWSQHAPAELGTDSENIRIGCDSQYSMHIPGAWTNWRLWGKLLTLDEWSALAGNNVYFVETDLSGQIGRVVDGDTFVVNVDYSLNPIIPIYVRLHGVNAPEMGSRKNPNIQGWNAKARAMDWISERDSQTLTVEVVARDKYGRTLARIRDENGETLNDFMINNGFAEKY